MRAPPSNTGTDKTEDCARHHIKPLLDFSSKLTTEECIEHAERERCKSNEERNFLKIKQNKEIKYSDLVKRADSSLNSSGPSQGRYRLTSEVIPANEAKQAINKSNLRNRIY